MAEDELAEAQEFCEALSKMAEDMVVPAVQALTRWWNVFASITESGDAKRYDGLHDKYGIRARQHELLIAITMLSRDVHGMLDALEVIDPALYKHAGGVSHQERKDWMRKMRARSVGPSGAEKASSDR